MYRVDDALLGEDKWVQGEGHGFTAKATQRGWNIASVLPSLRRNLRSSIP